MRQIWAATYLSIFLLVGLANAADQAQKEERQGQGGGTGGEGLGRG